MTTTTATCDTTTSVTRSLLGYGIIAGPLYVAVSVTQALVRPGWGGVRVRTSREAM